MEGFEFRLPRWNGDGGIDCEINHPEFGWIPNTVTPESNPERWAAITAGDVAEYVAPAIEALRLAAGERAKSIHAQALTRATGNATREEIDTWALQTAAAKSILSGTATAAEESLFTKRASERGVSVEQFAALVSGKADQTMGAVGDIGAVHDRAQIAIATATNQDEIDAAIAAMQAQLSS